MAEYINPFHVPENSAFGPSTYITEAAPVKYKGFSLYQRDQKACDIVKDGLLVGQCVNVDGAKRRIDQRGKSNG